MPQPQPNTGFGSQNIDWGSFLGGLLQTSQARADEISNVNAQTQANQQRMSSPTGMPNVAMDAATKVAKQAYTQHAQDLASTPQGLAVLSTLVDLHNNQQNNNSAPAVESTQNNTNIPQETTSKQSDYAPATNYIQDNNNPVVGLFKALGFGPSAGYINAMANYNLSMQQAANLKPENVIKQAIDTAKAVPLTQEQQATIGAGVNTATIQAYNDSLKNIASLRDSLNNEFKAEQATISPLQALQMQGKPFLTPRMKEIQGQLKRLGDAEGILNKRFAQFQVKNPAANVPVHTGQQIDAYNKARASGLSVEQAKKKAGI